MLPKTWPRPASRRFVNYFAATLRSSFREVHPFAEAAAACSDYGQRDNAMLLTTSGQMLFTMALFGVVAGALLLIAIAVDDAV